MLRRRPIHISPDEARKALDYDPETGVMVWRDLPEFRVSCAKGGRAKVVGKVAGTVTAHGYRKIKICGRFIFAHRLAWLIVHGEDASGEIDHINGDRLDNRIQNLRIASHAQNAMNGRRRSTNTAGLKGVYVCKPTGRYIAQIVVDGANHYLGTHDTAEAAHAAYVAAAERLHGEFARAA